MPDEAEKQYGAEGVDRKQRNKILKEKEHPLRGEHVQDKDSTPPQTINDNNMIFLVK